MILIKAIRSILDLEGHATPGISKGSKKNLVKITK